MSNIELNSFVSVNINAPNLTLCTIDKYKNKNGEINLYGQVTDVHTHPHTEDKVQVKFYTQGTTKENTYLWPKSLLVTISEETAILYYIEEYWDIPRYEIQTMIDKGQLEMFNNLEDFFMRKIWLAKTSTQISHIFRETVLDRNKHWMDEFEYLELPGGKYVCKKTGAISKKVTTVT